VLQTIRAAAEARMPGAFARLCPVFDRLAARNPHHEVHLLPLLAPPGEIACDVGANRGLFTYWLLRNGSRVVAFEPNPHMVRVLERRFPDHGRGERLTIVPAALGDTQGSATLHIPLGFSPLAALDGGLAEQQGVPLERVQVPLHRLDDCVEGNVAFLKLDAEGYELKILAGALEMLARAQPTILVEAEERHRAGAVASLRNLLEPMGYRGFFRDGAAIAPIAAFDPARHQARDALNAEGSRVLPGRTYVNNFIFAARPQVIAGLEAMAA
jgi:FkbM family methyltransferase